MNLLRLLLLVSEEEEKIQEEEDAPSLNIDTSNVALILQQESVGGVTHRRLELRTGPMPPSFAEIDLQVWLPRFRVKEFVFSGRITDGVAFPSPIPKRRHYQSLTHLTIQALTPPHTALDLSSFANLRVLIANVQCKWNARLHTLQTILSTALEQEQFREQMTRHGEALRVLHLETRSDGDTAAVLEGIRQVAAHLTDFQLIVQKKRPEWAGLADMAFPRLQTLRVEDAPLPTGDFRHTELLLVGNERWSAAKNQIFQQIKWSRATVSDPLPGGVRADRLIVSPDMKAVTRDSVARLIQNVKEIHFLADPGPHRAFVRGGGGDAKMPAVTTPLIWRFLGQDGVTAETLRFLCTQEELVSGKNVFVALLVIHAKEKEAIPIPGVQCNMAQLFLADENDADRIHTLYPTLPTNIKVLVTSSDSKLQGIKDKIQTVYRRALRNEDVDRV